MPIIRINNYMESKSDSSDSDSSNSKLSDSDSSSNNDINVPENYCFAAEVGLSGEIRPVNRVDQRIKEAEKLGFSKVFISKYCDTTVAKKIEVVYLTSVEDLIDKIS